MALSADQSSATTIPIKVHFTGGLEIVFSNLRSLTIDLPIPTSPPSSLTSSPASTTSSTTHTPTTASSIPSATTTVEPTIAHLIQHLSSIPQLDSSRKDLFALPNDDTTVRPGILVLVNDADWALEGEGECVLKGGDEVVFVSTLHGG